MIVVLIIVSWLLVLTLVAGLCAAARAGDVELLTRASAHDQPGELEPIVWEPAVHLEISAHSNTRPAPAPAPAPAAAESGASLARSGGLAA